MTLASIPLVATAFHRISLVGWATNVFALPVASVLTLACAATAGALLRLAGARGRPPPSLASLAARALLTLVQAGAAVPLGTVSSPGFPWPAAVVFALGLLGLALGVRRCGWLVAVALGAVLGRPLLEPRPPLEVTALPVGHGGLAAGLLAGRTSPGGRRGCAGRDRPRCRIVLPLLRDGASGGSTRSPGTRRRRPWPPHRAPRGSRRSALASRGRGARPAGGGAPRRGGSGAGRVALRGGPAPAGRDHGGGPVAATRCSRPGDGERPQPGPLPRGIRPIGAASGRCRSGGGGRAAASGEHRGEGAAPWLPELELATADLVQPGVAGDLLGWTGQSLPSARTGGGGALEGERRRSPPHRRGWSDPRPPRRLRRPLGNARGRAGRLVARPLAGAGDTGAPSGR